MKQEGFAPSAAAPSDDPSTTPWDPPVNENKHK